jgi:hypothetical protein
MNVLDWYKSMMKRSISDHGLVSSSEEVFEFGQKQQPDNPAKDAPAKPPADIKLSQPQPSRPVAAPAPSEPPLSKAGASEPLPPEPHEISAKVLSESPRPPAASRTLPPRKEVRRAAELAAMIAQDLSQHPDAPKQGLRVTVYGGTDWRAMLTIMPAAGRVRDPQVLRDLTNELAARLRQHYDMAWE